MGLGSLKGRLSGTLGVIAVAAIFALALLFLSGIAQRWIYPYLLIGLRFGVIGLGPVIILAALFRRTRDAAAHLLVFFTQYFTFTVWVWAFMYVESAWGIFPAMLGLFLGGIGVFPIAAIAALVHGAWHVLGELIASWIGVCVAILIAGALKNASGPRRVPVVLASDGSIGGGIEPT